MAAINRHEQDLQDILRYAEVTVVMGSGYHTPLKPDRRLRWLYDRPEQPAEDVRSVAYAGPAENPEELRQ